MRELVFKPYAKETPSDDAGICVKLGLSILGDNLEAGDRTTRCNYAELVEAYSPLLMFERVNTAPPGAPEQWAETIRMRYEGGTIKLKEAAYILLMKAWDAASAKFPAREAPLLIKVDAYLEDIPIVSKDEV